MCAIVCFTVKNMKKISVPFSMQIITLISTIKQLFSVFVFVFAYDLDRLNRINELEKDFHLKVGGAPEPHPPVT